MIPIAIGAGRHLLAGVAVMIVRRKVQCAILFGGVWSSGRQQLRDAAVDCAPADQSDAKRGRCWRHRVATASGDSHALGARFVQNSAGRERKDSNAIPSVPTRSLR
jgi:hypothetical protein